MGEKRTTYADGYIRGVKGGGGWSWEITVYGVHIRPCDQAPARPTTERSRYLGDLRAGAILESRRYPTMAAAERAMRRWARANLTRPLRVCN
jgi:hypothetical protein